MRKEGDEYLELGLEALVRIDLLPDSGFRVQGSESEV